MVSKEKMEFAAKQVVDVCLKAKNGDASFVVTDRETKHVAEPVIKRMKEVTGKDPHVFIMEDFGNRPVDGLNPLEFPNEIGEIVKKSDVGAYIAQGKKNELASFRKPLMKIINESNKLKYAHMIGVQEIMMETGMASDYQVVKKITNKIYDIVKNAKKVKVTTARGTDFTVELSSDIKWCPFDGDIQPGKWMNLPEGEIFTTPNTVNGKIIVDGVLGDHMVGFGILEKNPVNLEIKNGRVTKISCSNTKIEEELNKYIQQDENANRIGEFAIGTNIELKSLIGNLLQDEKFPGVHIAVGDSLGDHTGAKWQSKVHADMVIQKTTIEVDGKMIMKDGKFLF